MDFTYETSGTCSSRIDISINDDSSKIESVKFYGGCNGNLKGISALAKGKDIDEVIDALKGIKCGFKNTSCPDQLAIALEDIKEEL